MFGWREAAERADALERDLAALRDMVGALVARLAAVEERCAVALPQIDGLGALAARLEGQDAALDEGRMATLRLDRALKAQADELGKVGAALFERIEALRRTP